MQNYKQCLIAVVAVVFCSCNRSPSTDVVPSNERQFVGSSACKDCHKTQFDAWQGSHHQLAMQLATTDSVLGDFSNAIFEYFGTITQFLINDEAFVVRTANADGEPQEFRISHTFGVEPLQQYLVDFPGGRKQALPFAWDSRAAELGGQRWFHLSPDEYIAPDDPLHWTGRYFNWNYMCAECHSTDVELNYDIATDSFATTFEEVSVGCEACHGSGSLHVGQAKSGTLDEQYGLAVNLDDRGTATWTMNADTGIAERSTPATAKQQPESCGRCHARRSVLTANYKYGMPLTDTHMPALLEENLYFPDGRIQDEVYVYGSFIQSKMYAAGVTCSDCHNPHSGALHTGADPNEVCSQCHLPAKFANRTHSNIEFADCVSCHMPATTYMGVDDRRDHSFRKPGAGEDSAHYGAAIAAARAGPANPMLVTALANSAHPAIARATMLTQLAPPAGEAELTNLAAGIDDPDPIMRIAALRSLRRHPTEARIRYGSHLLRDAVRGVRIEAALTYAEVSDLLPLDDIRAYSAAADEYRAAMLTAASMPDTMTNLADFESRAGNTIVADNYFKHAIKLDQDYAPARHVYGLYLVRDGRSDEALEQLRQAATLAPDNSRYAYTFGVALNSLGNGSEALSVLAKARSEFPYDFDIAWALATMLRDSGNIDAALALANEMAGDFPENTNVEVLRDSLAALDR